MKIINLITIILCAVSLRSVQAADLKGLVKNQGETFNFEIAGQKNWDYDLKRIKDKKHTKIQLFIKVADENSISKISQIENPFVESVSVINQAAPGQWLIEFVLKN